MRRSMGLIAAALLSGVTATASGDFTAELDAARAPLGEGVPEVAVVRLRALLNPRLKPEEWRTTAEALGAALVLSKQPREALSVLNAAALRDRASATFWRAQALATLERWPEALGLYRAVANDTQSPLRTQAAFGVAEALRGMGDREGALRQLQTLFTDKDFAVPARLRAAEIYLDKKDPVSARQLLDETQPATSAQKKERRLLRGRMELLLRNPERAIAAFQPLLKKPENASHDIIIAALSGIADAHLQMRTPEAGDDVLEDFIERHAQDADVDVAFAKLDELYRAERKIARTELERWSRDPAQPRRALALWYLARLDLRAGRRDRALESFGALRRTEIKSSMLVPALLEYAQLKIEEQDFDNALAILRDAQLLRPEGALRDRVNLLAGSVQYRLKRFAPAATAFEAVGRSESPWSRAAMFNAALGWLRLGDYARFAAAAETLQKQGGDEDARARLRLEEGLQAAARGEPQAAELLRNFIHDFPHERRVSEAWVALAELAFHAQLPRIDEAKQDLSRAAAASPTSAAQERADYLVIWLEDAASNDTKVIELANRFLREHSVSAFAADVRMKLAELYYRRQDLPNAQTQFEMIAQQNPASPTAEKALFFAAESAMSSMGAHSLDRAMGLLDQVVRRNGDLKWTARNEQALVERKLGKPQDALLLYDEVLKSEARPSDKREALCGKGDILFEAGGADNYRRAIEAYDQLAADKEEPVHWRNQALFKKGLCLEKAGDRAGALTTFYGVVQTDAGLDPRRELFWYYKAGFNAARLLEEDAKWESAAAIYGQLVAAGGPRSDEARQRLERLRLEHFLWGE